MKALISIVAFLACAPAGAVLIEAKASDFSNGTNVTSAYESMTLRAANGQSSQNGNILYERWPDTGEIKTDFAYVQSGSFSHQILQTDWSSGLFGNDLLMAQFNLPVDYVSMTFRADQASDTAIFHVYDSSFVEIHREVFVTASAGDFTLDYSSVASDISYAVGTFYESGKIRVVTYNVVPIPQTFLLFSSTLAGLAWFRSRRDNLSI